MQRQARSFGLTLAAIATAVGLLHAWRGHAAVALWLAAGALLAAIALWWPRGLLPVTRLWLKLGAALHAIVNPVVMALLYALAIVPTGIAMRLVGKDLLRLRRKPQAATYWIARDPPDEARGSMKDQF